MINHLHIIMINALGQKKNFLFNFDHELSCARDRLTIEWSKNESV